MFNSTTLTFSRSTGEKRYLDVLVFDHTALLRIYGSNRCMKFIPFNEGCLESRVNGIVSQWLSQGWYSLD